MASNYSLFVIFGFLAVVLFLEGLYLYWSNSHSPEVKRVRSRLNLLGVSNLETGASFLKKRILSKSPQVGNLLQRIPGIGKLDHLLLQAGSNQLVLHVLIESAAVACIGIFLAVILGFSWQWYLTAGVLAVVMPVLYLRLLRTKRIEKINAQLPEALNLISRALRSGNAFSSTLSMVGNQSPEPIAGEFKTTFNEISLGISTQDALHNLANRVPITDMRYFVMAVLIQLETGGNLAELLTMLGGLIRDRFKLFGKIQVIAAEGKLSGYILVALPFGVAGVIQLTNPDYLSVLFTDDFGRRLTLGALIMMAIGALAMWRIIKIRI